MSASWILSANSWMQTPAGVVVQNGRLAVVDWYHVDHLPIHRLANEDDAFAIGGRFPKPNPKRKVATTPLGGAARCRKS